MNRARTPCLVHESQLPSVSQPLFVRTFKRGKSTKHAAKRLAKHVHTVAVLQAIFMSLKSRKHTGLWCKTTSLEITLCESSGCLMWFVISLAS